MKLGARDALDFHEGRKKAAGSHEPEPPVSHPPRRHLSCPSIGGNDLSAWIAPTPLAGCDIFHIRWSWRSRWRFPFTRIAHRLMIATLRPSKGKGRSTTGDGRCDEA